VTHPLLRPIGDARSLPVFVSAASKFACLIFYDPARHDATTVHVSGQPASSVVREIDKSPGGWLAAPRYACLFLGRSGRYSALVCIVLASLVVVV